MRKFNSKPLSRIARIISPLIVLVVFLVVWEFCCSVFSIAPYILPTPHLIFKTLISNFPNLIDAVGVTLFEALLGFLLAIIIGFLSGYLFSSSRIAEYSFYPYMITLKAVPIIAIAPLLITWFGDGILGKVIMSAIVAFFPIVVNATTGFRSVDEQELLLFRTYSASNWQIFKKLRLPSSLPYLLSALKLSSTMAILGAIVAEFVGAKQGIGLSILLATYHLNTPQLFAAIIVIAVTSVIVFMIIGGFEMIILRRYRLSFAKLENPTIKSEI